jgi:hypothetical protein
VLFLKKVEPASNHGRDGRIRFGPNRSNTGHEATETEAEGQDRQGIDFNVFHDDFLSLITLSL